MIPQIGPRLARRLVAYAGSVEAVFAEKSKLLEKIPGIGESKASGFDKDEILKKAEIELQQLSKKGITARFYLDADYPYRLKECEDAPIILFSKGETDFNASKIISIVGTRRATEYGRAAVEEIVGYLAARYPKLIVVSGLAYGIDILAHRAALKNNLHTIAALGHGLDFIYPAVHRNEAAKIEKSGALVTEFPSGKKADPGNFISRNRIIAGLADATIIVESAQKGGALITADLANSYNRDVYALPGRNTDTYSKGCNALIKQNKAALFENGADIELALRWTPENENRKPQFTQQALFSELSDDEKRIVQYLSEGKSGFHDEICYALKLPTHKVSAGLTNLEFNGMVRVLPGKQYQKI